MSTVAARPAAEQDATLARFEAAPAAPESLPERVACALWVERTGMPATMWPGIHPWVSAEYQRLAAVALAVVLEDARR